MWKETSSRPWKLKTLVKVQFPSKVVCIQKSLEYATINLCCSQQTSKLQTWIPFGSTWAQTLGLMVEQCILNKTRWYWLLSDVLSTTFSICIRMHKDYQVHTSLNPPLICGKLDVELEILYGKMAFKVINVLEHFLAFAMTFNVVFAHNMCALQLDPRFKGL